MTAKRSPLEHVRRLIKKLSAEERQSLIPFLASLPSSGVETYDAKGEIEALKKHGKRIAAPADDPDKYLVGLTVMPNLVLADIRGIEVLYTRFLPDKFIEAFPQFRDQIAIYSKKFQENPTLRSSRKANLAAQGIEQSDSEFEVAFKADCDAAGELCAIEKAKRMADQISMHLPGMVGDMLAAAIKGQTFYDFYKEFQELKPESTPPSLKDFKKAVQDAAWREVKPHLPSTKHIRTHPDWRGEETRKIFAQRVNDRKLLATSIKDKYEECDFEAGWIEDLKQDATFVRLASDVPQMVIDLGIKRVASDLSERERQPLSIALEMARLELNLQEQDVETLHKYYSEGLKVLKAQRTRPPSSI